MANPSVLEPLTRFFKSRHDQTIRHSGNLFCPFHACLKPYGSLDPKAVRLPAGAPQEDQVLARAYDLSANPRLNPVVHTNTQQDFQARVQEGGIPLCPACHSRLVPHQGTRDGGYIAILGERAAGKTVYLASTIRYLRERPWQTGVSIHPHVVTDPSDVLMDKSSLQLLASVVEDPVRSLPMATDPTRPPFSYSFEACLNGEGQDASFNLLFLDSAGERQVQGREWLSRYILHASGLLLLVAPESISGLANHLPEAALRGYADQPVAQMLVDAFARIPAGNIPPLMVALSKADLLAGPGQPLGDLGAALRISEHQAHRTWMKEAGVQWSRTIESILRNQGFDTTFLDRTFPRITYTAISSTGGGKIVRNQSLEQSVEDVGDPWRCLDSLYFFRHAGGMR